ncbi:uncharacterized protein LOC114759153 [Neltuma alba]|uniref:uncharacterized protein LOC114759153 n=1 Tax=Neltuma alba TaxID=207710 RepID=UPI0010A4C5A8|nr:uncharacterized protein LOC114759153 [Prosopis alba]
MASLWSSSQTEDYSNALIGGLWMIYDHYLTVQPWQPKFRPETATIDKVAVCVRLSKVSLEYYDEEALIVIGNRIGKTFKVDMNTSCQLRGHFARICVLVELGKQFMQGFNLDGEEHYLEYEGLHLLCTNCGIYGHRNETCPLKKAASNANVTNPVETEQGIKEVINAQDQWNVVQKVHRQRKTKEKQVGNSNTVNNEEDNHDDNNGARENEKEITEEDRDVVMRPAHTENSRPMKSHTEKGKKGTIAAKNDKKKKKNGERGCK